MGGIQGLVYFRTRDLVACFSGIFMYWEVKLYEIKRIYYIEIFCLLKGVEGDRDFRRYVVCVNKNVGRFAAIGSNNFDPLSN